MTNEATLLTQTQIQALYTRGIINRVTWANALRSFHGDHGHVGQHAIRTCEVAIEALVERAVAALTELEAVGLVLHREVGSGVIVRTQAKLTDAGRAASVENPWAVASATRQGGTP